MKSLHHILRNTPKHNVKIDLLEGQGHLLTVSNNFLASLYANFLLKCRFKFIQIRDT